MARTSRSYWGVPNYKKPKRTSSTFSRPDDSHNPKDRDRRRDRNYLCAKIADDGRERVKRCLNCEHFSSDLINCNQCGWKLREDAKIFLNPLDVRSVFKHIIHTVTNMGPDFLPMRVMNECPRLNSEQVCGSRTTVGVAGVDNFSELEGTSDRVKPPEVETETTESYNLKLVKVESVITISSDDESENESTQCNGDSEENGSNTSSIKDEDASDLINQMQSATCPPNTNYFVKKCDRCQTYSFDLQNCETCGKKMSQRMGIILYQSLSSRKLKSDRWRKAKYYVARQEKHKIPIPVQQCDMNLVDKIIAKRQSIKPGNTGKKKSKGSKKSRNNAQQVSGAKAGVDAGAFGRSANSQARRKQSLIKEKEISARRHANFLRNVCK